VEEQFGAEGGGEQPELDGPLGRLQPGDVLVVPHLDSLAEALNAGASRRASPSGPHSKADPALSRPTLHDDRDKPELVNAGRPAAPPPLRRRRGGRPPKLSWQQQGAVLDEVLPGRHTAADMARRYKVSAATISHLLAAHRAERSASSTRGQVGTDASITGQVVGVLPVSAVNKRLAIVGTSGELWWTLGDAVIRRRFMLACR